MAVIESQLDAHSDSYKSSVELMRSSVEEMRAIEQAVVDRAQGKAQRYIDRGYLPPRERLSRLLDPGTAFLELSTLCGYMQDQDTDGSFAGGSVIAGIGYISGTRCGVMVDDYLTKGGIMTTFGGAKRQRMHKLCLAEKLPLVTLAQSGGGNLTTAGDVFGTSGEMFANQCRLSAAGVCPIPWSGASRVSSFSTSASGLLAPWCSASGDRISSPRPPRRPLRSATSAPAWGLSARPRTSPSSVLSTSC